MVIEITEQNFENEVLNSEKPVLVDFWASWCGPCRMLSPVVDEIAAEYNDIKVGKINVDKQQRLAEKYGVMSIPTLIYFVRGKAEKQSVGAIPRASILELIGK